MKRDIPADFIKAALEAPLLYRPIYMAVLNSNGWSFCAIGKIFNISRQRVHKIVKDFYIKHTTNIN